MRIEFFDLDQYTKILEVKVRFTVRTGGKKQANHWRRATTGTIANGTIWAIISTTRRMCIHHIVANSGWCDLKHPLPSVATTKQQQMWRPLVVILWLGVRQHWRNPRHYTKLLPPLIWSWPIPSCIAIAGQLGPGQQPWHSAFRCLRVLFITIIFYFYLLYYYLLIYQ